MPSKEINLLPEEEFEKKPLGKFLSWASKTGRWIVILVNIVVIAAFLSRFKLDRDLNNLKNSVRTKQAIIQSAAPFEREFRQLQNQLVQIDKLSKNQLGVPVIISSLSTNLPDDVSLTNLSIQTDNSISLVGIALSGNGLQSFSKSLSQSTNFVDLNISNVKRDTESGGGIKFTLTAKFKK